MRRFALLNDSQRTLDASKGALTLLLIAGSWCVVRAVQAVSSDARRIGVGWLLDPHAIPEHKIRY